MIYYQSVYLNALLRDNIKSNPCPLDKDESYRFDKPPGLLYQWIFSNL